MPATSTFLQRLLTGQDFPSELKLSIHRSRYGFVDEVRSALPRQPQHIFVGLAIFVGHYDGLLEAFAIALPDGRVFVLQARAPRGMMVHEPVEAAFVDGRDDPDLTFENKAAPVALGAARIAMQVRHKLKWEVKARDMRDLYALASPEKNRNKRSLGPGQMVKEFLDDRARVFDIEELWDKSPRDQQDETVRIHDLCLRAWLTARLASKIGPHTFQECEVVDTRKLPTIVYRNFHKLLTELEMIRNGKSRQMDTEFSYVRPDDADGKAYTVQNERFANKLRPSEKKEVILVDENYNKYRGRAIAADGRKTKVVLEAASNYRGKFSAIYSLGVDDPDTGESKRTAFLLNLLKGKSSIEDPRFDLLRKFFFHNPDREHARSSLPSSIMQTPSVMPNHVNESQRAVVEAIVTSNEPFVVVQGPPGTGKTATISLAVQNIVAQGSSIYVIAHSNMSVKNVADRLLRDRVRFKVIVSSDYYDGWNEHIYEGPIKSSLLVTRELPRRSNEIASVFKDISCILCTLGTLCAGTLEKAHILTRIPPIHVIVDEASQIKIIDYMPVFLICKQLRKMCFFGDPDQIIAHDSRYTKTLQTVYDVAHLESCAYFLDTQYRMPYPIALFISSHVYTNRLRSFVNTTDPSCLLFVDVKSNEVERFTSYVNHAEADVVEAIVARHVGGVDYTIISPYDAQKKLIQDKLKDADLRWDNVASADAFQGSESDFIIVSLTRSRDAGFMKDRERGNVILTRSKKGTIIVTSRSFMKSRSMRETLIGEICQHWETEYGKEKTWISGRDILEGKRAIPGLHPITSPSTRSRPVMSFSSPRTDSCLSFLQPERVHTHLSPVVCPPPPNAPVRPVETFKALQAAAAARRSVPEPDMDTNLHIHGVRPSKTTIHATKTVNHADRQMQMFETPRSIPIKSCRPEPTAPASFAQEAVRGEVLDVFDPLHSSVERWRRKVAAPSTSATSSSSLASHLRPPPSSLSLESLTEIETSPDAASSNALTKSKVSGRSLLAKTVDTEIEMSSFPESVDGSDFFFARKDMRVTTKATGPSATHRIQVKKSANWMHIVPDS